MTRWFLVLLTSSISFFSFSAIVLLQWPNLQKLVNSTEVRSQDVLRKQAEHESQSLKLWAQAPAIGFGNIIADWTFLSFLQYFGDEDVREKTAYSLSPQYFEVILDKDPYFWDAYLFLSGSTTLYAGQPDRTIEIMEAHLPKVSPKTPDRAYFIWRWKATDELLFLDDPQAAQSSHQVAAQWAAEYDTDEGRTVSANSAKTAEFLSTNPNSRAVQVSAWISVYGNAFDQETRELAIDNIRKLGGNVILDEDGNVVEVRTSKE